MKGAEGLRLPGLASTDFTASVREVMKLTGAVEVVLPGTLPRDGLVIEDTRSYD